MRRKSLQFDTSIVTLSPAKQQLVVGKRAGGGGLAGGLNGVVQDVRSHPDGAATEAPAAAAASSTAGSSGLDATVLSHLERLNGRFDRLELRSNATDLQLSRMSEHVESLQRLVLGMHDTMRSRSTGPRQKSRAGLQRRPMDSPSASGGAAAAPEAAPEADGQGAGMSC